jgi:hypothetical protein
MKNLLTILFFGLLGSTFFLTSCKKDETSRANEFTLNDVSHPLTHGYKIIVEATEDSSFQYVLLCSETLNFSPTDEFTGYGDVVYFGILTASPTDIVPGTYSTSNENFMAAVIVSYDEDLGEGIEYSLDNVAVSSVIVKGSGNSYEFEYTLTLETGKVLKGYYKGSLESLTFPVIKSYSSGLFEKLYKPYGFNQ